MTGSSGHSGHSGSMNRSQLHKHMKLVAPLLILALIVTLVIFISIGHTLVERCPFDRNRAITSSPYRSTGLGNQTRDLRMNSFPVYLVKPEVHDQILNMYILLQQLFDRDQITYWASAGTFLGTVRHQGFIPWDDDMDICVGFSDVRKVSALSKELEKVGFGLRVYRDNISYVKLVPLKGIPYPFIDIIFMEEIKLADWPSKCPQPRIHLKESTESSRLNDVYLVPRSVDPIKPYYPAEKYPKEIHPYGRVFPLTNYPYHRPGVEILGPHDTSLLDEMYPGCMEEARVEEKGIMQLLKNHRTRSFTNSFLGKKGIPLQKYADKL